MYKKIKADAEVTNTVRRSLDLLKRAGDSVKNDEKTALATEMRYQCGKTYLVLINTGNRHLSSTMSCLLCHRIVH